MNFLGCSNFKDIQKKMKTNIIMYVPVLFFKIKLSSCVLYGTYLTGTSTTQNI